MRSGVQDRIARPALWRGLVDLGLALADWLGYLRHMETVGSSLTIFNLLVIAGVILTLAGLALLGWCVVKVVRAKRAQLSDEDLRAAVQKVVPLNLGALCLSVLGLMMVILGISLG